MQVAPGDRQEFHDILNELLREGKIMITPKEKYKKPDGSFLTGIYISNHRGFGFVEVEGREQDLFIPEEHTNGAFHNDLVQVALIKGRSGKRQEARVIRIVERGTSQVVGTFESVKGHAYGFVIPDDTKLKNHIFIPGEYTQGAVDGHKVVVEITDYGEERKNPEGKIMEIIGHINDPGVDIMSIVRGFDLPVEFTEKQMNQAMRVSANGVTENDRLGRKDLRDVTMVTIDGEDAKDLDDAVSIDFDGTHYHLGVHIADVTNYVQESSALDREALKRGTSVYLVDRVIPMLPHTLSNGICSLNEGEDRLTLSCLMTIDQKGEVTDYEICESVINVNKRMSYTVIKELLEDKQAIKKPGYEVYTDLLPDFKLMKKLANILRKKRFAGGAIDFDFPECKILLDKDGHPTQIKAYERNVATGIIEEFMLAANRTVAQHFYWLEVYRIHQAPDPDRITKLALFIQNFGFYMKTVDKKGGLLGDGKLHPKEIQKLLEKVAGSPMEAMVARMTLRSMKQAKYSVECSGHFGLACQYYCHFTSPIRRYPDLQIHRIIKDQLRGRLDVRKISHYNEILPDVAKNSSDMERRAAEAERETDKLKKVEYMEDKIGQEFDGVISGITGWGMYVELPNTVEGLIHISKIQGDYFYYDESLCELIGEDTGKRYRLGMPVRICVDDCDRFNKTIDFSLVRELD